MGGAPDRFANTGSAYLRMRRKVAKRRRRRRNNDE
jgi:hypothetical protein